MYGMIRQKYEPKKGVAMNFSFADRVQGLNPSALREILKYAADPEVVSLSAGNPAPEAFPVRELADISADIFAKQPIDALQYNVTEGYCSREQFLLI